MSVIRCEISGTCRNVKKYMKFFPSIPVVTFVLCGTGEADDRRWITDQHGQTVGYVEPAPVGDRLIVRDKDGKTVGVVDRGALSNGSVILDHDGDRLGRIEGQTEGAARDRGGRDWRDGPRQEWGSHEDRW